MTMNKRKEQSIKNKTKKSKKYNNPYEEYPVKINKAYKKVSRIPLLFLCIFTIVLSIVITLFVVDLKANDMSEIYRNKIESEFESKKDFISNVAVGLSSGAISSKSAKQTYLDEISKKNDCFSLYYYNYNENVTIKSGYSKPDDDFFSIEEDWYSLAAENPDDIFVSIPYKDKESGKVYITFSKAVLDNGRVSAVVGLNYDLDRLAPYITKSYENDSFDPFHSFNLLYSDDLSILLKPSAVSDITIKDSSKYIIDFSNGLSLGIYKELDYSGLKIVTVTSLLYPAIFLVILIVLYIVLYFVLMYFSYRKYSKKISNWFTSFESINNKIYEIGKGNFDVTFDEEAPSFEIYTLTTSLNDTVVSLKEYVEKITNTITSISEKDLSASFNCDIDDNYAKIGYALDNLKDSLNDSLNLIDLKAETISKCASTLEKNSAVIASNATNQNNSIADLSKNIDDLEAQTNCISESAETVQVTAKSTGIHLLTSRNDMQSLILAMESVNDCYVKISELISKISDFADRTSVLSLNASIEATRAGIIGKDFALVAAQINQLATECNNYINKIELLMSESSTSIMQGKYLVEATANTFTQSVEDSSKSSVEIDKMLSCIEVQMNAIMHINDNLKQLSAAIESNAANAEENAEISAELTSCSESLKNKCVEYL